MGLVNSKTHNQELAIQKLVTQNFEKFIESNTFTQKNLEIFEAQLIVKLQKIVNGLTIDVEKTKSTKLNLDGLKNTFSVVSPKGAFTTRGKTAQTGRDAAIAGTLPDIDSKYDRSISNNRNVYVKKVNNLFNHNKENARYSIDQDSELIKNKAFADIRVNKLGKKKIPDKFAKSLNTAGAEDIESIPSDIEADQWAEINKYDYELYQEQLQQKKQD